MRTPSGPPRLDPTDWAFLTYERAHPEVSAEIGQVLLFDGEPPTLVELISHVEKRLHLLPRLSWQPPVRHPWLLRPRFEQVTEADLGRHIRELRAEAGSGAAGLHAAVDAILNERLDHTAPLWQLWLIHGHAPGEFALFYKVHHAVHDGVALNEVTQALFAPEVPPDDTAAPVVPDSGARRLLRWLYGFAAVGAGFARWAPELPLNRPLSGRVRLVWCEVPIDRFRAARGVVPGATLNDVYLAALARAVRSWLSARREESPERIWSLVPVNIRRPAEEGMLGNRVAAIRVPLPGSGDAREVLAAVTAATRGAKTRGESQATGAATRLAAGLPAPALRRLHELSFHARLVNVMASNVAGLRRPLDFDGRQLRTVVAVNFLPARQRLSLVLMSYQDRVAVAFTGDADLPWLDELPRLWTAALDELADTPR